ncbi:golvesin C-terminal-like domain-containing protein [Carboxylicivirga taeanensis]|uniref:golvesin C-terminal-like domain-containing protein n=1 Tax=Carboxylicivirga taeanensis TaxID=1416875 RepID=UPI003F6DD259
MMSLFNINTVARFESKTLFRSWFFRIFAFLILGFILMFNLFGLTGIADGGWPGRLLPSGAPYFNMWLLNIAQSVIAVFLSADFLGRDKKLDTTEAFYVRSMSNSDYVIGKTLGVLKVFLLLNALVMLSAFLFSTVANEVAIPWTSYLFYPLLMSLPTLIFILGLSFFTMTLIRNQAVTFVLLLGFIALSLFYLGNKYSGLFDVLGFYTPFMRSDFTGFQNLTLLIGHRLIYFALGLMLILATIWRLPRLEQQRFNRVFLLLGMALLLLVAVGSTWQVLNSSWESSRLLTRIQELNSQLKPSSYQIDSYELELKHQGSTIACNVQLVITKHADKPMDLVLALNPGLQVRDCRMGQESLHFEQDNHLLRVELPDDFKQKGTIELAYEGVVLDAAMYADINAETRLGENRTDPLLAGKQYSFIQPDYLLLTRESNWYPVVATKQYWTQYPFTSMLLKVSTQGHLKVISQGQCDSLSAGNYQFTPEQPQNAYSVIVGDFEKHSIVIDSVEFNLFHHRAHDFYKEHFTEIGDTLPQVIKTIKGDFERKLGLRYPYKRFSVVEVPINMYSYLRNWNLATENCMPEMVLFPENGGGTWQNDLANNRHRVNRRTERSNEERSEKELQVEVLKNYLGDNFIAPSRFFFGRREEGERHVENWGRYQVFPLYFTYTNRIIETGYSLLTIALENYLHQRLGEVQRRDLGGLSSNDEVILKLRDNSLQTLIDKEDVNTLGNVFASKGSQLFSNLKVNMTQSNFDRQLDDLLMKKRFVNEELTNFTRAINAITSTDFKTVYHNWLNESYSPAFLFSTVDVAEVKDGNWMRYFLKTSIANKGNADGIVAFTIREGMQRGGRGRFRGRAQTDAAQDNEQSFVIKAGQTYELGFLLDAEPREVVVNTFLAANIPSNQTLTINETGQTNYKMDFFEGIRESARTLSYTNQREIIVDNEDEGFSMVNTGESRTLKDWWASRQNEEQESSTYGMVRFWNPPVKWEPVAGDKFFGEYVKSAVYKRKGSGEGYVAWKVHLAEPGSYAVYAFVPNVGMRFGRRRDHNREANYQFTVHHDDGEDDVKVTVSQDNDGWLYLGEYYFSKGSAKVQLTDETDSEFVIADAVKWEKK